jgi:hypothetical protein
MRKLRLSLDTLQVESFTADTAQAHAGTVIGNVGPTQNQICWTALCPLSWDCSDSECTRNIYCVSVFPCFPTNGYSCQCQTENTCAGPTCAVYPNQCV